MDFKKMRTNTINAISEKSPEILIGFGLAGMLTSTILAVKATPKALDILEECEYAEDRELSKVDKFKLTWKCYAPAALGYCVSAACIIGANSVNAKRNAVLAGAYKLSESALLEYRDKVTEVLGEEKEKEIRDAVAKDRVDKDTSRTNEVIITGKGDTLCYDMISGRYFKSDIDKINKAVNEINYRLTHENIISLNEFYMELDMKPTEMGYEQGWNIDDGLIEVSFSSIISEDGQPCIVMHFDKAPKYGFDKLG